MRQGCCNGDETAKSDEEPVCVGGRQISTSLMGKSLPLNTGCRRAGKRLKTSGLRRLCILMTRRQLSAMPIFGFGEPYNKMKMKRSGGRNAWPMRTRSPRTPLRPCDRISLKGALNLLST